MTLAEMKAPAATTAVTSAPVGRVPVVQTTVAAHDKLLKDQTVHRHLAFDDCCQYCDVHCVERLSPHKQQFIQDWTQEVNRNISRDNDRFEYITKQSAKKLKKEAKLKFQNYSPPGSPDIDDGFRMIPTPVSLRSRKSSATSTRSRDVARGAYVARRKLQTTPVQAWDEAEDKEIVTRLNHISLGARPQNNSQEAHHGSAKSASAIEEVGSNLIKNARSGVIRSPSFKATDVPPSDSAGLRTCSNTLLNVYSIDDAFRHHRNRVRRSKSAVYNGEASHTNASPPVSKSTDLPTPKPVSRSSSVKNPQTMRLIVEEDSRNTIVTSQHVASTNEKPAPASSHSAHDGLNETVQTAFTNLENSKEVTNNIAHKGLYIFETQSRKETSRPKESKLFRRMNKNLQRVMSEQYQHGSDLALKIRQRYANRRPTSHGTTKTTCSSTHTTHTSQASRENAILTRGKGTRSYDRFDSRDADSAEHFLEMLMDMDQNVGSNGNVNIHTFLYV